MKGKRNEPLLFYLNPGILEAGCDEAGRGCLAGPVVAAAVILKTPINALNDSKKLNEKTRQELALQIKAEALTYSISFVNAPRIDEINILNASIEAMHLAVMGLDTSPESLLIDGNRFHAFKTIPHHCIIKGDAKFQAIAAASILAKTARDEYMKSLHSKFPNYHWNVNKGYPTAKHVKAIKQHGITDFHRKTFGIVKQLCEPSLFDER